MHKIFPHLPHCVKDARIAHKFCLCYEIQFSWCSIFRWYSHALKVNLDPDPETALFGIFNSLDVMGRNVRTLVAYGMIIAKRCIMRLWKSDTAPKLEAWLKEFVGILAY